MLKANQVEMNFNTGKKFPVGIHQKCRVSNVALGDNFIDFEYTSEDGGYYGNKRVWFPELGKVYPREVTDKVTGVKIKETPSQALARDTTEKFAHLVKHLHIFLTPEEFDKFEAPDFVSAAEKTRKILLPKLGKEFVNLMLIYDKAGEYSEFGNYPNYIEKYVEGTAPTLQYSKYEKENRLTPKVVASTPVPNNDLTKLLG